MLLFLFFPHVLLHFEKYTICLLLRGIFVYLYTQENFTCQVQINSSHPQIKFKHKYHLSNRLLFWNWFELMCLNALKKITNSLTVVNGYKTTKSKSAKSINKSLILIFQTDVSVLPSRRGGPLLIGVRSDHKLSTDHIPILYRSCEFAHTVFIQTSHCVQHNSHVQKNWHILCINEQDSIGPSLSSGSKFLSNISVK